MRHWLNKTHVGDCRVLMRKMIADGVRVQCIVTSPPYWGLRDYGVAGQFGLEQTWIRHVARMRGVFRLARQLLADDGVLWLNYGDSYANDDKWGGSTGGKHVKALHGNTGIGRAKRKTGIKPKNLIGMPWRIAFALQSDAWYLRSDIIWHKSNPMPESVTDRPTKAHEYVFLLSRSEKYFYDAAAIREQASENTHKRLAQNVEDQIGSARANGGMKTNGNMKAVQRKKPSGWDDGYGDHRSLAGRYPKIKDNDSFQSALCMTTIDRNSRSVWKIPTEGFKGAHFATFPQALVRRCILAGSRPGDIIFDPFMGSGTTAQVATDLGRQFIGCELNPDYVEMSELRRTTIGLPLVFSE